MVYRVIPLESFLHLEMIQTACSIRGKEVEDLRKHLMTGDVIDHSSLNNLKRKTGALVKRFSVLDEVLIEELCDADARTTEFITFYSSLKNERILFDFLNEVIFSSYIKLKKYITIEEVDEFMIEKARQIEEIRNWSESSTQRMRNKVIGFSVEGGYLTKQGNEYNINLPSVNRRVKEHLKKIESAEMLNILFFQEGI